MIMHRPCPERPAKKGKICACNHALGTIKRSYNILPTFVRCKYVFYQDNRTQLQWMTMKEHNDKEEL